MHSFWLSEDCWILRLEEAADTEQRIRQIEATIQQDYSEEIVETVSTTQSIGVYIKPSISTDRLEELPELWRDVAKQKVIEQAVVRKVVQIPVVYGGEEGPDLEIVAEHAGLTPQEVIELHTSVIYPVRMIGFAPGFPYLSGLPEAIHAPRKTTPRSFIPAGSVGIAGGQTGVYSISTPGGWQIIGRTTIALFLPDQQPPSLVQVGDAIQFVAVERGEEHA